jgi:hypothetical protein
MTASGHGATITETAGLVIFLVSHAAAFITLVYLPINGGCCAR